MNRSTLFFLFVGVIIFLITLSDSSISQSQGATASPQRKIKTGIVQKKMPAALQGNNIKVDNKITGDEKKEYNAAVDQSNQYTEDQATTMNKVPGVNVNPEDLKQNKKEGPSLNPIRWLFGPVIKLEEQSVLLEQQIMKLTGPIAALQPSMLGLEHRMTSMQGQLGHLEEKTTSVENELVIIRKNIVQLKEPIVSLRDPILHIARPINGVDKDLNDVKGLLGLVITSIYAAAIIISLGTPVASILIWRNRDKLLPKPDAKQQHEEERIKQATKTMDHQLRS